MVGNAHLLLGRPKKVGRKPTFYLGEQLVTREPDESREVSGRVRELARPVAADLGLEVVDVEYLGQGGRSVLRIYADRSDRPGTVSVAELAELSRRLGDILDAYDAVPGRYCLEVSSPGVNRRLVGEADFRRYLGRRVRVRTREPLCGRRNFLGRLREVTAEGFSLETDGEQVFVSFAVVDRANYEHDFSSPERARR